MIILRLISIFIISLSIFTASFSSAEEFTAATVSDYGNVTVMEVSGNYDAKNPDGSLNSRPREIIAKEFYRLHKDEYDFLVIFSNFDFLMPESETKGLYHEVRNDTSGIGLPLFDNSSRYGSNGRLQGIIDMGNVLRHATNTLDPRFEGTLSVLSHELTHRWGAYVKYRDPEGVDSSSLLGKDGSHWSYLLNSYGSVLYGNHWQDNGDGTYTSIGIRSSFSPLDLYLMGFSDKSKVPPMLLIENTVIDPSALPEAGITISGTPRYISIDDIIAAEGERSPGAFVSQKTFRTAFLLITSQGAFTGAELPGIEDIRNSWVTRFSILTDGQGIMQVSPVLQEDIPENPGINSYPVNPRTQPPSVEDGLKWLMSAQQPDGSWMDSPQTRMRDTSEALSALINHDSALENFGNGLQWLAGSESGNSDYLSRKTGALASAGRDVSGIISEIIACRNPDGGWGSSKGYMSNPADTALMLQSLALAGYSDNDTFTRAIAYLKSEQNPDGGWGTGGQSNIFATTQVLLILQNRKENLPLEEQIAKGISWLLGRQNPDGGFGNSPSTLYDTAMAVMALRAFDSSPEIVNKAVNYIFSLQSDNGSWHESPCQTALAIRAAEKGAVDPDLSIRHGDITSIPSSVKSLPAHIVISARIRNSGMTGVAQAKVELYDGEPASGILLGEQAPAFPGQSDTTVTFPVVINDGNEHRLYLRVDPDSLVRESNETNNISMFVLSPDPSYDFEIRQSDIVVSQSPIDIFRDVKITAQIRNKGTLNAYTVPVRFSVDNGTGLSDIAAILADIPANSSVVREVVWKADRAGKDLVIAVSADPSNLFSEISEDNNTSSTSLTVNSSSLPNLTVSHKDIIMNPSPAQERGSVNISALIRNEGASSADNITVKFYKGIPGDSGVLVGTVSIQSLGAGESRKVSADWVGIMESGDRIVYVRVDPDNQIAESSEDDNEAFAALRIHSLPDLLLTPSSITFSPAVPKEGDTVSIDVIIHNSGGQAVQGIPVRLSDGNTVIGAQVIPSISGNSLSGISFAYDTTGQSGAHHITVAVDPDNLIGEQNENNNSASRTLGIQDGNLWLTETFISPNGDGIKDHTEFFFRLAAPQTVKVAVVNDRGMTVRTFAGSVLENTAGNSILWDGLDSEGMVVDDGRYEIRIIDPHGTFLNGLSVVVDNNRLPLISAIGTSYLMNSNLTCRLPDFSGDHWKWSPDESEIVFSLSTLNNNTSDYPPGIYSMTPDGMDSVNLLPYKLAENDFVDISSWKLSPDGERIAFLSWKYKPDEKIYNEQLWTIERSGKKMELLFSRDQTDREAIIDLKWSPDSRYILYSFGQVSLSGQKAYELWIEDMETLNSRKLDWGYLTPDISAEWSPDGSQIAYFVIPEDGSCRDELKVSDVSGNKKTLAVFGSCASDTPVYWMDNGKIAVSHPSLKSEAWLFDSNEHGSHIKLTDGFEGTIAVSPDRQKIAYVSAAAGDYSVNISGTSGESDILHEFSNDNPDYLFVIGDLRWSPDSSNLAFIKAGYPRDPYQGNSISSSLIVAEVKTKQTKQFDVTNITLESNRTVRIIEWLSDNLSMLLSDVDLGELSGDLSVISIASGKYQTLLSTIARPALSPRNQYITYLSEGDSTGTCNPKYQNLWTMNSLLNLTAALIPSLEKSAVILRGIAADLNFGGYKLEFADIRSPNKWTFIASANGIPVINDIFTAWIPPGEGTFLVRLTVWDKAGGIVSVRKRISWGVVPAVGNLYMSEKVFSPNGDGILDTVELKYSILEPVHLEFLVLDGHENVIASMQKDHSSRGDASVLWDGRDRSGKIVPDGHYTIRIFTYDFPVTVDNTFPEVSLILSPVQQDSVNPGFLYSELKGHATDTGLRKWTVEYGEGDNPQEWLEFRSGDVPLGSNADAGDIENSQSPDNLISRISGSEIEWLVGKKLRITAEDYGGNRASAVTGFLEERIILHSWDSYPVPLSENASVPPYLSFPGTHSVGVLETKRLSYATMNAQYWNGKQWISSPASGNLSSGWVPLEWNTSDININEIHAVRIKGVDLAGQEHYSNMFSFKSLFRIESQCGSAGGILSAENSLPETLTVLRLQVQSNTDMRYAQPTDFMVYDTSGGREVPVGIFYPYLPQVKSGMSYTIIMTGTGLSGKTYESSTSYPPSCPLDISLDVRYEETDCNRHSGKTIIQASPEKTFKTVLLKELRYFLGKTGGEELVGSFDLSRGDWQRVSIDTSGFNEGKYPVRAVVTYLDLDDNTIRESSASGIITVDHVLPSAQITSPDVTHSICPVRVLSARGDWYAIPIEGIVNDGNGVKQYSFYYSPGDAPEQWIPAMTRVSDEVRPLTGRTSVNGKIGLWDISGLRGSSYTLKLTVTDNAKNTSCVSKNILLDTVTDIVNLTTDVSLISPNNDGISDGLNVIFGTSENVTLGSVIFPIVQKTDGSYGPGAESVRTLTSDSLHLAGTGIIPWDGLNDSHLPVSDGRYAVALSATDACGNSSNRLVFAEVDTTPPVTVIAYPGLSDAIANNVEIRGTADDLHLTDFLLEAGKGDVPEEWITLASANVPVKNGILGRWDISGLNGRWTLKLTANDSVGNRNINTSKIDIGKRQELFRSFRVTPDLFSPNNDGKIDTALIAATFISPCNVSLEVRDTDGMLRKSYSFNAQSGDFSYSWDGRDNKGIVVQDGIYKIKITAKLISNPSVLQEATSSVSVDNTLPVIQIRQPQGNSFSKNEIVVNGTVSDLNLIEYSIRYSGDSGEALLDMGARSREDYIFGILNNLPEGRYTLKVSAKDLGSNITEQNIIFYIDRTPPNVVLALPKEGEFYGAANNTVLISGEISERNLEAYKLRYASGDTLQATAWTDILAGNTLPETARLLAWKVGKDDGIADGLYTISLLARDKAGFETEARVGIIIDNTPPETTITSPRDGEYVRKAKEIRGTASDPHLAAYTLEISSGPCDSAVRWAAIKTGSTSEKDGVFMVLKPFLKDGDYCIRLRTADKSGNRGETKTNIRFDTRPPAAPMLSGSVKDVSSIHLEWTPGTETDLAGYFIYRNNQRLNMELQTGVHFIDTPPGEGVYSYHVIAADHAGNESVPSQELKFTMDVTGPEVKVSFPKDGSGVSRVVDIRGTAYSPDDFRQYRVYIGQGADPSQWNLLRASPVPVTYGLLAQWDTMNVSDGAYVIRVEAEDISGNTDKVQKTVIVDNTMPAPPVLLSATAAGTDIVVKWQANTETDLSGYLVYRNDRLANAPGVLTAGPDAYVISGTSYTDSSIPDGKFRYYLEAVDQAGNISAPSNSIEVSIDNRTPSALIVDPEDKFRFEHPISVRAESPDRDVASVNFQYRKAHGNEWKDLGNPVKTAPYMTSLNSSGLGISYGDLELRAVATDSGGKTDASPSYITVTYTDLTAPSAPVDLAVSVNGGDALLAWKANEETDLDGYIVYRTSGTIRTKLNASVISESSYRDSNLPDGTFTYELTAVDKFGNESGLSESVRAKISAPFISQPYTPVASKAVRIHGSNAEPLTAVNVFVDKENVQVARERTMSDSQGDFVLDVSLAQGENGISARTEEENGNMSKVSEPVFIVRNEPPSAPTGLAGPVNGDKVSLSWNTNAEGDISGYNLFRNTIKVNLPSAVTSGVVTASSYSEPPARAFDADPSTSWSSPFNPEALSPVWLEIALPSQELISHLEIQWGSVYDYQGNEILCAGRNFELLVWSGHAWISRAQVTGNNEGKSVLDFSPSYRTDRIRVLIADTTAPDSARQVRISEITILKDNLIAGTSYDDSNMHDGEYHYQVKAVDYYGFESLPSEEVMAQVGDIIPPSAPVRFAATVSGNDILLAWANNPEPDIDGYNIYRGTASGNGYQKQNTSPVRGTFYRDSGAAKGVHFFYVTTAVDTAGNESAYSDEADALIPDNTAPPKPFFFYPSVSGIPGIVYRDITDIAGTAEPGSRVELFRDGVSVGYSAAADEDVIQGYVLNNAPVESNLSQDGKTLAYTYSNSVWSRDLLTGIEKRIIQNGTAPVWAPDGRQLAYSFQDESGHTRIGLFSVNTGDAVPVTSDLNVYEGSPSWSSDGDRIAFISNRNGFMDVWEKDLVANNLVQVTSGSNITRARISPDGSFMAIFENQRLSMIDLATGESTLIDALTDGNSLDWARDSRRFAFVSGQSGNADIFVMDMEAQALSQITSSLNDESRPEWSPDGREIAFFAKEDTSSGSVRVIPLNMPGEGRIVARNVRKMNSLCWAEAGAIAFTEGNSFTVMYPAGQFRFADVAVYPGENLFHSIASDASGNSSEPSDSVSVVFETSRVPDLELAEGSIFVYPPFPMAGEETSVTVSVLNRGHVDVSNVRVDIYLQDPVGTIKLLASETVSFIQAQSADTIGVIWRDTARSGRYQLMAVVDPMDEIHELVETNNRLDKTVFIVEKEDIILSSSTDRDTCRAGEDIRVSINLKNPGPAKDVVLEVFIEDEWGNSVASLGTEQINLSYAADETFLKIWNTGDTFAGFYSIHTVLKDNSGVIAEEKRLFSIVPDAASDSSIVTDSASYETQEDVSVTVRIVNKGGNTIIPETRAKTTIEDPNGTVVFSEERLVKALLPGAAGNFEYIWNTGHLLSGIYSASVTFSVGDQIVTSASVRFDIEASDIIEGVIELVPNFVMPGNTVQVKYSVYNAGNLTMSGMSLKMLIVDQKNQAVINSGEENADLRPGEKKTGQFEFSTKGYAAGSYQVILQSVAQGNTESTRCLK
jgi:Tol biopolymer transport system component/subtilase family serine protease/flagellar hook assembly protein FlgD